VFQQAQGCTLKGATLSTRLRPVLKPSLARRGHVDLKIGLSEYTDRAAQRCAGFLPERQVRVGGNVGHSISARTAQNAQNSEREVGVQVPPGRRPADAVVSPIDAGRMKATTLAATSARRTAVPPRQSDDSAIAIDEFAGISPFAVFE
jgi:hypothetical protein